MTSHEQRFITKELIATHNLALYSSTYFSDKKLFKNSKAKIQHYKPVFFYKLCYMHGTPTFETEALRLFINLQ